jgi:hypothetical protein
MAISKVAQRAAARYLKAAEEEQQDQDEDEDETEEEELFETDPYQWPKKKRNVPEP